MKLIITDQVHQQVMHWVNKATFEVSGFGIIHIINGDAVVTEAILLKQEGASASTEISSEDINRAEYELRKSEGEMRWWWHSHVKMGCFWSGTDMDTIRQLGDQGWFFHTVFNQKDEYKTAFSCPQSLDSPMHPARTIYFEDDITTEFPSSIRPETLALWDKIYDDKVTEKKWQSYRGSQYQMDLIDAEIAKSGKPPPAIDWSNGVFETRAELEAEIEELIYTGMVDTEIEAMYGTDIRKFKVDIRQIRQEFFDYTRGM